MTKVPLSALVIQTALLISGSALANPLSPELCRATEESAHRQLRLHKERIQKTDPHLRAGLPALKNIGDLLAEKMLQRDPSLLKKLQEVRETEARFNKELKAIASSKTLNESERAKAENDLRSRFGLPPTVSIDVALQKFNSASDRLAEEAVRTAYDFPESSKADFEKGLDQAFEILRDSTEVNFDRDLIASARRALEEVIRENTDLVIQAVDRAGRGLDSRADQLVVTYEDGELKLKVVRYAYSDGEKLQDSVIQNGSFSYERGIPSGSGKYFQRTGFMSFEELFDSVEERLHHFDLYTGPRTYLLTKDMAACSELERKARTVAVSERGTKHSTLPEKAAPASARPAAASRSASGK